MDKWLHEDFWGSVGFVVTLSKFSKQSIQKSHNFGTKTRVLYLHSYWIKNVKRYQALYVPLCNLELNRFFDRDNESETFLGNFSSNNAKHSFVSAFRICCFSLSHVKLAFKTVSSILFSLHRILLSVCLSVFQSDCPFLSHPISPIHCLPLPPRWLTSDASVPSQIDPWHPASSASSPPWFPPLRSSRCKQKLHLAALSIRGKNWLVFIHRFSLSWPLWSCAESLGSEEKGSLVCRWYFSYTVVASAVGPLVHIRVGMWALTERWKAVSGVDLEEVEVRWEGVEGWRVVFRSGMQFFCPFFLPFNLYSCH